MDLFGRRMHLWSPLPALQAAVRSHTLAKPLQIESEHLTIITLWASLAPSPDDIHHCQIVIHTTYVPEIALTAVCEHRYTPH